MEYQIGDRVKLLHENEEGKIIQVLPGDRLLVSIDDLLELEVAAQQVVLANPKAARKRTDNQVKQPTKKAAPERRLELAAGVYLGLLPRAEDQWHYLLVNHSSWQLQFTAYTLQEEDNALGKLFGGLGPNSAQLLARFTARDWKTTAHWQMQLLFFREEPGEVLPAPLDIRFRLRSKHFQKDKLKSPYADDPLAFLPLVELKQLLNPVERKLEQERPVQPALSDQQDIIACEEQPEVVDLHIDKLLEHPESLSKSEILEHQLKVLDRCLDRAVSNNLSQLTLIHGQGEGKLRNEVHRRLLHHPHVAKWEPEREGIFGYGATVVKFKA